MGRFPPVVRFLIAFVLLTLLVAAGTLGYHWIEGWPLGDSLYMTFITMTTVGFQEVRPLSAQGQHFTIIFLVLSISTFGYSVTVLISFIFEGQIVQAVRERRMKRNVRRIKDHYIICGGGDVGREIAREFQRAKAKFLVVDRNPQASELARDESVIFLEGDASDDEVLIEANIERAKGLIAALPDDEANVFVVLTARQLNPKLMIVSQASERPTFRKLLKAGANRVISPKEIAGQRMASFILRPSLVNFLDVMVGGEELGMRIEEVPVKGGSPLIDKNLREAGIGQHTGAIVVGINGPDGRTRVNPNSTSTLSSVTLKEGDVLIALGTEDQLGRLSDFVKRGK
ncbi:MAG: potassium channel protein [Spirochaetales bacterium]|nr:potassium channel protein [Spirochaetales bacterium]